MQVSILPASQCGFEEVLAAFNAGYEGYLVPVNLNTEQFRAHLTNNDIDVDASRMAVLGTEVAGVALLGRRDARGWVGGIGVISAYRNRGIGRQLMGGLLEAARESGLATIQLEVIVGNDAAYHLYQKLGFHTLRRLLILERSPAPIKATDRTVRTVSAVEALAHYEELHPTPNPWQRERETLLKLIDKLSGWVETQNGHPSAYAVGVVQPDSIRWFDLAANNVDALRGLLAHVHNLYPEATARLVNLAEGDPVWRVLSTFGYREIMSQREMQLAL